MKYSFINILYDNYIWFLIRGQQAIIVDCGSSTEILQFLQTNDLQLTHILLTHGHEDHVAGLEAVKDFTQAQVIAHELTTRFVNPRLVDVVITNEAPLQINDVTIHPLYTPGHCIEHTMYFFPHLQWLFTGDTIFTLGCGRAFYDINSLYSSLKRVMDIIPKETLLFPGHNYLKNNLQFLYSLKYFNTNQEARSQLGSAIAPTTLAWEMQYNPFLNANNQQLKSFLHHEHSSDLDFFKFLRKLKDEF